MEGKNISQINLGDTAQISKTITEADVVLFAGITCDFNPVHLDEVWAKGTRFRGRIVHGMLSAGLISAAIGTRLPGPGTIYLSQDLKFLHPVRIGDTLTAKVEVVEVIPEKNRLRLATKVENQEGMVVVDGVAWVMPPTH